jgi:Actinobacteria/chloroflexi VLRF1 release factor
VAHGGVGEKRADVDRTSLTFRAADGAAIVCTPPFPPLAGDLLEHVRRERTVGVLLVRLGGHAAGVFAGRRLVASKVGSRPVHGRHRAGGSSAGRFARRRAGQARVALQEATSVAARVLVEPARRGELDAVVRGGDRGALERVLADARLAVLRPLLEPRVLDVPDPRLRVLEQMPERFLATVVETQTGD